MFGSFLLYYVYYKFSFINNRGDNKMYHFFNPKRNRFIAGIIVIVLVASMILTAIVSFIG